MRIDKDNIKIILILLVVCLSLGYAYINSDLNINGTAQVNSANWDVHWANIQVSTGSVSASSPTISNQTTVNYSVTLNIPGDYYEFTVDAVNGGSIDAMIDSIDSKLNGATITTLPDYLNYTVTYSDGVALEQNHQLLHNTTEKYKVRIEYRTDIELNQLPATNQTLSLEFTVTYRQTTDAAVSVPHPISFATDEWTTIINAVRAGSAAVYNVGDTKTVDMGSFGTHTLRIANKSTPAECSTPGFSQTACGFVLEFADIITTHVMNSSATNIGGWPASEMRIYVNDTIYNALPEILRNAIIDTEVVSKCGCLSGFDDYAEVCRNLDNGGNNYYSIDKIYLLSTEEICYGSMGENRCLDYYSNSDDIYNAMTKNQVWWLRDPNIYNKYKGFYSVVYYGIDSMPAYSYAERGVSPAFRIG